MGLSDGATLMVTVDRGVAVEGRVRTLAENAWKAFCEASAKQFDCALATRREVQVMISNDGGCGAVASAVLPDAADGGQPVGVTVDLICIRQQPPMRPDLYWVTGYCSYAPNNPPLFCKSERPLGQAEAPPSPTSIPVR